MNLITGQNKKEELRRFIPNGKNTLIVFFLPSQIYYSLQIDFRFDWFNTPDPGKQWCSGVEVTRGPGLESPDIEVT